VLFSFIVYSPPAPLGNFQLALEPNIPSTSLITWSDDSTAGDELEVPPPRVEDSGDKNSSKHGTSKGSHVEELSSNLMQLKFQRKIDKLKTSKSQQLTFSSSSNQESDASSEEEVKGKRGRKRDKKSYNTTFNNHNLPPLAPSPPYRLVKPPVSMGRTIPNGSMQ
jgi:hypothetical protein